MGSVWQKWIRICNICIEKVKTLLIPTLQWNTPESFIPMFAPCYQQLWYISKITPWLNERDSTVLSTRACILISIYLYAVGQKFLPRFPWPLHENFDCSAAWNAEVCKVWRISCYWIFQNKHLTLCMWKKMKYNGPIYHKSPSSVVRKSRFNISVNGQQ